ncbi:anti-sigma factor [Nocardia sp. NPDC059228]|uniref:anti-sigma factor n=1 Tax=Nocardia sp. NPDC059228 TaxID=3346777 RepID=UPI0036BA40DE
MPDAVAARMIADPDAERFVPYFEAARQSAPGTVELHVPAEVSYLWLLRTVTENIMLTADFTLDVMTDVGVALDEVASELMVSAVHGAVIECEFRYDARRIRIRVTTVCETDSPLEEDGFARKALGILTDSIQTTTLAFNVGLAGYPVVVRFSRSRNETDGW